MYIRLLCIVLYLFLNNNCFTQEAFKVRKCCQCCKCCKENKGDMIFNSRRKPIDVKKTKITEFWRDGKKLTPEDIAKLTDKSDDALQKTGVTKKEVDGYLSVNDVFYNDSTLTFTDEKGIYDNITGIETGDEKDGSVGKGCSLIKDEMKLAVKKIKEVNMKKTDRQTPVKKNDNIGYLSAYYEVTGNKVDTIYNILFNFNDGTNGSNCWQVKQIMNSNCDGNEVTGAKITTNHRIGKAILSFTKKTDTTSIGTVIHDVTNTFNEEKFSGGFEMWVESVSIPPKQEGIRAFLADRIKGIPTIYVDLVYRCVYNEFCDKTTFVVVSTYYYTAGWVVSKVHDFQADVKKEGDRAFKAMIGKTFSDKLKETIK